MSKSWIHQSERGSPFAVRLIIWIALHLGRPVARAFLFPIALYFFLAAREQRAASQSYLTRSWGRPPSAREVVRHIHCFASTVLDRVFLLTDRHRQLDIRIHRPELVLDLAETGRGCILLGSHIGSFEVLRALAVERKRLPLRILMDPEHNRAITKLFAALNPQIADTVIPLGGIDTLLRVKEALAGGCMVGMLGDRVTDTNKVTHCRFLGADAGFPAGPAILASTLKVPVILFVGLYRGGRRYDVYFEALEAHGDWDRSEREDAIRRWTQSYADRLAYYLRLAPYNWFNFYDFWNEA
jgi:predicted LPLAT superfamily acyltransferase